MVIWLTHKLRATFEIEPSEPHFILRNLLLTRNIVSSPRAHPCGRNCLSPPPPQPINFFLPPPPSYSKFRTKSCPPPSRKGGGGRSDTVLFLTFTKHWLCPACRSNHFKSVTKHNYGGAVGRFSDIQTLTYLSGRRQNTGLLN